MEHPKELEEWKPKRSQSLAQRQYALLCAALLAVKPGGTVMYSTCSISHYENDDVIAKLLKKKGDTFKLMNLNNFKGAEKTEYGLQFLPDNCGFGPMYCCKIQRVSQ
jgi:16S rRNA C967 or C1407 C5-methylase (RsmB/RsmF family)